MLTIQPKINSSLTYIRIPFKGKDNIDNQIESNEQDVVTISDEASKQTKDEIGVTEETYRQKKDYYGKQAQEWNDMIDDDETPPLMKKIAKAGKITTESVLGGWGVAFCASKSAKNIKSLIEAGINSKVFKGGKKVFAPIGHFFKEMVVSGFDLIGKGFTKIKDSSFGQKISKEFENMEAEMDKTNFGHKVVSGVKYITEWIKLGASVVSEKFNLFKGKVKTVSTEDAFNKCTNAGSAILGSGAGVTTAYVEATKKDEDNNKLDDSINNDDIEDDVEQEEDDD